MLACQITSTFSIKATAVCVSSCFNSWFSTVISTRPVQSTRRKSNIETYKQCMERVMASSMPLLGLKLLCTKPGFAFIVQVPPACWNLLVYGMCLSLKSSRLQLLARAHMQQQSRRQVRTALALEGRWVALNYSSEYL